MNRLQIIIIVTGVVFILFALDLYQRKKFTFLHFLIFGWWVGSILFFLLNPTRLDTFGQIFGLARGADLIVYLSIIFLGYGYIEMINSLTKRDEQRTQLARSLALHTALGDISWAEIIFVIPSFSEDETVILTVQSVVEKWFVAVVIDDGYNQIDLASALSQYIDTQHVLLITHPLNMWQWAALQTGADRVVKYSSQTKYIVHFDADGQHDVSDISQFLDAFAADPDLDIVLWSRTLWSTTGMETHRMLHKRLQVLFMRLFVWLQLSDTNNGYRMIKTSSLKHLKITSNRMAHASQLENLIAEHKLNYQEVPVTIAYTEYSKNKWQKLTNMFSILRELFYKWWFYK